MAQADDIRFLIEQGKMWIAGERAARHPQAQRLSDPLRHRFSPYFGAAVLDAVRIQLVPAIPNPPFYARSLPPPASRSRSISRRWRESHLSTPFSSPDRR
jgi:hypothetical protein